MHSISGCDTISSFSHIGKITTFQTLKDKINKLTDLIDFGECPSVSLESLSVATSIQTSQVQVCMNYGIEYLAE